MIFTVVKDQYLIPLIPLIFFHAESNGGAYYTSSSVNFGYNQPGYNELRIIRTFFSGLLNEIVVCLLLFTSVITNFVYTEPILPVPWEFVITEVDCSRKQ